jgi:hypothetical protein
VYDNFVSLSKPIPTWRTQDELKQKRTEMKLFTVSSLVLIAVTGLSGCSDPDGVKVELTPAENQLMVEQITQAGFKCYKVWLAQAIAATADAAQFRIMCENDQGIYIRDWDYMVTISDRFPSMREVRKSVKDN